MGDVNKQGTTVAKYCYLSDGTKLSATDASGNGLYYVGSLVYEKQGGVLSVESAGFSGGRFLVSQTSGGTMYSPHYYVTDHLGSTRVITNVSGQVQEACDYYPFGLRWHAGTLTTNRYRYNGKEEQGFLSLPYIDYGARMYDPNIGRMHNTDRLAELYSSINPFAYCLNNPINAIDPDGNLVIFINGFTMNPFEKGSERYWRTKVDGVEVDFSKAVQDHLNDHNVMYRHGGNSLFPKSRERVGKLQAMEDFSRIIDKISTDGAITETIKIITHSMGTAFGKGYVRMLQRLLKKYNYRALISLVADFDPYQANDLQADSNVFTMQFTHLGSMADQRQQDLPDENYYEDSSQSQHSIMSFFGDISKLKEGNYYWNGYTWVLNE